MEHCALCFSFVVSEGMFITALLSPVAPNCLSGTFTQTVERIVTMLCSHEFYSHRVNLRPFHSFNLRNKEAFISVKTFLPSTIKKTISVLYLLWKLHKSCVWYHDIIHRPTHFLAGNRVTWVELIWVVWGANYITIIPIQWKQCTIDALVPFRNRPRVNTREESLPRVILTSSWINHKELRRRYVLLNRRVTGTRH